MIRGFPEPERFTLDCPAQQVLDIIANKWSVIVLYCLVYGSRRYGEIQQRIEGISQKVLTQTLRRLERNGLLQRHVISEMPPSVEYSLTALGESIIEPLQALAGWSIENFEKVAASREQYDEQNLS